MEETPRFRPVGSAWLSSFSATHSFYGYPFGKILLPILDCHLNKGVFLMLVMISIPIG